MKLFNVCANKLYIYNILYLNEAIIVIKKYRLTTTWTQHDWHPWSTNCTTLFGHA